MNLLVTNTRTRQAYSIIRALRPYAQKIVVTMYGKNRLVARLSHAANSRLVDKRYYVPSPVEDWRAGRIQKENTEREEAYIQAVLRICEKEKIDTIFPSFDPQVYVFSKNKKRFEKIGVLIPIPDYEIVITPLDKYRTIRAAQEVGFPCPKTYLPESEDDLKGIADELGFPLVVKPRFSSAGRGTAVVRDLPELLGEIRLVIESRGMPLMQECIPGNRGQYIHLLLDRSGELKLAFHKQFHRYFRNGTFSMHRESIAPNPYGIHSCRLLKDLGWWGAAIVETRVDPRDNIPKLMEINPRVGAGLWNLTELGINEPWMCLKIARGEEAEGVKDYPVAVYLHPVEDALVLGLRFLTLLVFKFRTVVQGKTPVDPLNPPMSFKELIQSYKHTYFSGKKKIFHPYFRHFFQDPLVSIIGWLQLFTSVLKAVKEVGR